MEQKKKQKKKRGKRGFLEKTPPCALFPSLRNHAHKEGKKRPPLKGGERKNGRKEVRAASPIPRLPIGKERQREEKKKKRGQPTSLVGEKHHSAAAIPAKTGEINGKCAKRRKKGKKKENGVKNPSKGGGGKRARGS